MYADNGGRQSWSKQGFALLGGIVILFFNYVPLNISWDKNRDT